MSLQISSPYIHVEDANGNPYVGAKLYVYDAGTTTLASVFTDDDLLVAAANYATSNASGNFPRLYIAAGTYKLRCVTSLDVLIFEEDNIDTGLSAGTGALPVSRGGTGATTAAAARTNLDVPSNSELTTLSSQVTTLSGAIQNIVSVPQGYLTLTSATPVISADVSAGTTVYYTPFLGNLVPIYDGTQFNISSFAELSLTLNANHVASNIYDVFVFLDSATVTIGTGPAWSVATAGSGARGSGAGTTEITRTGGLWTSANAITARNGATTYSVAANEATYLGSLFIDGSNGQVTCHRTWGQSRKWGVWNAYNRKPLYLKAGDSTASWTYNTATIRQSNAAAGNKLTIFCGLAEEVVHLTMDQTVQQASAAAALNSFYGIGYNSTTAFSGKSVNVYGNSSTGDGSAGATHLVVPTIGIHNINALEQGNGTTNTVWAGGEEDMLLLAQWLG